MEVGAVKQAFNNEVILLKRKLNQAKTQVIHKLTRKAKTLTEKKLPEHLKEKLMRKAESAVDEVLIIKKIKPMDIAKFIITHTGELNAYLNRPKVDIDKACARLVLHKSLQEKYTFIRNRFGNVSINDLFMSRQERKKIKKEAREQQKNKKKGKETKAVVNSLSDWDVEDVNMGNDSNITKNDIDSDDNGNNDCSSHSEAENNEQSDEEQDSDSKNLVNEEMNNESDESHDADDDLIQDQDNEQSDSEDQVEADTFNEAEAQISDEQESEIDDEAQDDTDDEENKVESGKYIKLKPPNKVKLTAENPIKVKVKAPKLETNLKPQINKKLKEKKQTDRKVKENKNKNLKDKLQNRKFKKDRDDSHVEGQKVVDPFFITASGGNYLSLAEPRAPDEVKEIHKHGNRQQRRAVMFGNVPRIKPRRDNTGQNNFGSKFDTRNGYSRSDDKNNGSNFNDRNSQFNDKNNKFIDRNAKFSDRNYDKSNKFNNEKSNFKDRNTDFKNDKKDEKLHPSWEAKRKLKSMSLLPAQGKKIVFD